MTGKGDEMLNEESMETIKPVPQRRIADKMNEYMSRRDYAGAERHLLYWLAEAELGQDLQGQLMLRNEMVGHYRKTAQREKAMESAGKALELLRELGMEDSISAGTTYVNIATACNAFGEYERSLELFEKARAAYEGSSYVEPRLLGGLYNNMGLALVDLKRFREAEELYQDVPEEDRKYLQIFAFICSLSFDVYMKKLLITGFDPFGGETINPSWEAVKLLPEQIGNFVLCKLQVPTVFGLAAEKALEKLKF